jgi:hypothetical protein
MYITRYHKKLLYNVKKLQENGVKRISAATIFSCKPNGKKYHTLRELTNLDCIMYEGGSWQLTPFGCEIVAEFELQQFAYALRFKYNQENNVQ